MGSNSHLQSIDKYRLGGIFRQVDFWQSECITYGGGEGWNWHRARGWLFQASLGGQGADEAAYPKESFYWIYTSSTQRFSAASEPAGIPYHCGCLG